MSYPGTAHGFRCRMVEGRRRLLRPARTGVRVLAQDGCHSQRLTAALGELGRGSDARPVAQESAGMPSARPTSLQVAR
jgi:hypothetical protein